MKWIDGGVTAPKGFSAAGVSAGIKKAGIKDMAMVYSESPCRAAGVFTTNVVKAAPVKWDHQVVHESAYAQAVVVNTPAPVRRVSVTVRRLPKRRGRPWGSRRRRCLWPPRA